MSCLAGCEPSGPEVYTDHTANSPPVASVMTSVLLYNSGFHQGNSKCILGLLFYQHNPIEFHGTPKNGCKIYCISMPCHVCWFWHRRECPSNTLNVTLFLLLVLLCPTESLSQSFPACSLLLFHSAPYWAVHRLNRKEEPLKGKQGFVACLEWSQGQFPIFGTSTLKEWQQSCHGIHLV